MLKSEKSKLGEALNRVKVMLLKRITNEGLGAKPPASAQFLVIF